MILGCTGAEQPGDRDQLKPAALQTAENLRQRLGSGGFADVHQDDRAIELRVRVMRDSLDKKGVALWRRDRIEAVEGPIDRDVTKLAGDPQHPSIARTERSTPPAASRTRDVLREQCSRLLELGANLGVAESREIAMTPCVIAEFVTGADQQSDEIGMLAHPFSSKKKGAANSRGSERREERRKRIGFATRIERHGDAVCAPRSALQFCYWNSFAVSKS